MTSIKCLLLTVFFGFASILYSHRCLWKFLLSGALPTGRVTLKHLLVLLCIFISTTAMSQIKDSLLVSESTFIYSNPDPRSDVLGSLFPGDTVEVVYSKPRFTRVIHKDINGFTETKYLTGFEGQKIQVALQNVPASIHSAFAAGLSIPDWNVHLNGIIRRPNQAMKVYLEMYITLFSPLGGDYHYENIGREAFNDPLVKETDAWLGFNIGLAGNISQNVVGYLAAGYTHRTHLLQLRDPTTILGDNEGLYWVTETDKSGGFPNFAGGFYLSIGRGGVLQLGYNQQPTSVVVGYGWSL